ncbi:hypothetical protein [Streptomyces sp. NPDC001661]
MAAAVADDRPLLDEILRAHRFLYSHARDVYLLPSDTSHTTAVRAVARATRAFQDNGFSVAADPKILRSSAPPVGLLEDTSTLNEAPAQERSDVTAPAPSMRARAAIVPSPHRREDGPNTNAPAKRSAIRPTTRRRTR